MRKIVVAADSFKGSVSSDQVCRVIKKAMLDSLKNVDVVCVPIADGGEGTIEVLGAKKIYKEVNDAFFNPINSYWGKLGDYAIIELATAAGLPMAKHPNPMIASTFGVGELILDAIEQGERKLILALGGSSTNDLGCGIACALGAKFFNKKGESFVPAGGTLIEIDRVDVSGLDPRLKECTFTTMCDVKNPLYGPEGAAYVFAPQKGATEEMLPLLDAGLKHAAGVIERGLEISVSCIPGSGAAGGCGGASVAFLNSTLQSGIDTVLSLKKFEDTVCDADLVISGEGRFDSQSAGGKAVSGVAAICEKHKVPLVVLCGSYSIAGQDLPAGIKAVFSITNGPCSLEDALSNGEKNLYETAFQLGKLLACFTN